MTHDLTGLFCLLNRPNIAALWGSHNRSRKGKTKERPAGTRHLNMSCWPYHSIRVNASLLCELGSLLEQVIRRPFHEDAVVAGEPGNQGARKDYMAVFCPWIFHCCGGIDIEVI